MDRIMALREQAISLDLSNNNGARHAQAFTESVAHSGRLNELRLPVKTVGMFNLPALISFLPIGLRAMTHGKLPPLIHKSVENVQNVRRLFSKVSQPPQ
jgi:succinate dehydrogenase / fumarate reductase iron-sulfur subunit